MVHFSSRKASLPIGWYQLYCFVTDAWECKQLAKGISHQDARLDLNLWPVDCKSSILTTRPPSHILYSLFLFWQPFSRWTWVSWHQTVFILDFIGAKDDGGGSDNWSHKTCKAPVKSSPTTNQHPDFTGQMLFLSPNQQCQSTEVYWAEELNLFQRLISWK